MMKPFYTFQSDTYKIKGLIKMIGLNKRIIEINNIPYQKLNRFDKSEIFKKLKDLKLVLQKNLINLFKIYTI